MVPQSDDKHIWRAFSTCPFFTAKQLTLLLGRSSNYIQKRLQAFEDEGLIKAVQDGPFGACMYFLTWKGGMEAVKLGFLKEPRYVQKKSEKSIAHDSQITDIFVALSVALPDQKIIWEQWRSDMDDLYQLIHDIPDARVSIFPPEEFSPIEVVNANMRKVKDQEYDLIAKLREYMNIGIDRIYVIFPTDMRATNFLEKLNEAQLPKPYGVWISDIESCRQDILGKIWRAPANYKNREYSILKPEPHN